MFTDFKVVFSKGLRIITLCCFIFISSFKNEVDIHLLAKQTQLKLNQFYDNDQDAIKVKKYDITVTDDGFLRYRKTFSTGKQEYYSFNLRQLSAINYWGNTTEGNIALKTSGDNVIVQTYNDPKGNIDSMANILNMNLKLIEPEDLNIIQNNLIQIKTMLKK